MIYVTIQDGIVTVYSHDHVDVCVIDIDDQSQDEPIVVTFKNNEPVIDLIPSLAEELPDFTPDEIEQILSVRDVNTMELFT